MAQLYEQTLTEEQANAMSEEEWLTFEERVTPHARPFVPRNGDVFVRGRQGDVFVCGSQGDVFVVGRFGDVRS